MGRHTRPPRDDAQRSARFDAHVIPATIKSILETRLPGMQAGYGSWADHEAQVQAIVAGVLSGYSIPPFQYSRWYAFAMAVDRLKRKFAGSPGLSDELGNLTWLWTSRGYNSVILDLVRDSVLSYNLSWTLDTGHYLGVLDVNAISGHIACATSVGKLIDVVNQSSRTFLTEALATDKANYLRWCPELSICCGSEGPLTDVIFKLDEPSMIATEFALAAGDAPTQPEADYDPTLYGSTNKGAFWIPGTGHTKLYMLYMGGSASPTAITMPAAPRYVQVDQGLNTIWVSCNGAAHLYAVNRTTHAITTYTPPYVIGAMALDTVHGKLWLCEAGGTFRICHFDTTTHAFSTPIVRTDDMPCVIDTVRDFAYSAEPTPGLIHVVNGATEAVTTWPMTNGNCQLFIDPAACSLWWLDWTTSTLHKLHMISGYSESIPLVGPLSATAAPGSGRFYCGLGPTPRGLQCIMP